MILFRRPMAAALNFSVPKARLKVKSTVGSANKWGEITKVLQKHSIFAKFGHLDGTD